MEYTVTRTYEVKKVFTATVTADTPEQASEVASATLDVLADEMDLQEELTVQEKVEKN